MKDTIYSLHGRVQNVAVENVPAQLVDPYPGVPERQRNVFVAAARKIVVNDDLSDILSQQFFRHVRPDEACTANHQHFLASSIHVQSPNLIESTTYSGNDIAHVKAGET